MLDREKVRDTFAKASDLAPAQRADFLDRACGNERALRAEVDSLLAAVASRPAFLASPTTGGGESAVGEALGTRLGPYKLLEEIGRGGFGTVYLAEQEQPVRRRVALKIIKLGMDTRAVIARFEAERQALAMMDHDNIAKVFDGGATGAGRPYFVMELVRGSPITVYADGANLSVQERLALFIQVCQAVQHAHSKGVIHRDIKPSNVLVATEDGRPHAKVIDFGIAKATDSGGAGGRLSERTVFTDFRQLIGTPEYMSPEQAGGAPDVDTRSDVYSLGVLLYELLTGATPFDAKALRSAEYVEVQRIIREDEPPKPSTRLSRSGVLADVAALRRTQPNRLSALVTGDLDWIAMKALEKDRTRRYETPSALAADIQRHLAGEPVAAAPPSAGYRLRKFVRRNRRVVLAGAAVGVALLVGAGVSIAFGVSEARQRRSAEAARGRAQIAEGEARKRADELEQVAEFQERQLIAIDPPEMGLRLRADVLAKARAAAVRSKLSPPEVESRMQELERLLVGTDFTGLAIGSLNQTFFEPALKAIDARFDRQPLVRGRLLQASANVLRELGQLDAASAPQEEALAIFRRELGDGHKWTLAAMHNSGALLTRRGKYEEAEVRLLESLAMNRRALGEDHADTLNGMNSLGALFNHWGKLAEAERYYREVLEKRRRTLGEDHPSTLLSIHNMGLLLLSQGKHAQAEEHLRTAMDKRRRLFGDQDLVTLESINGLASALQARGKFEEAESLFREALDARRLIMGDEHPKTLVAIHNLGSVLHAMGRRAEAEQYYRESLRAQSRSLSGVHTSTLASKCDLAFLLMEEEKLAEAEPLFLEALQGYRALLGDEHANTMLTKIGLGGVLRLSGRPAEAVALLAPAEPVARRIFVNDYASRLGRFLCALGRARTLVGDFDTAESNLLESYNLQGEARGNNSIMVLEGLVELYEARHAAAPDKGYDAQRDRWRERLEALKQATPPAQR